MWLLLLLFLGLALDRNPLRVAALGKEAAGRKLSSPPVKIVCEQILFTLIVCEQILFTPLTVCEQILFTPLTVCEQILFTLYLYVSRSCSPH